MIRPGQPLPFAIVLNKLGKRFAVDASNNGQQTTSGRVFAIAKDASRARTGEYLVHAGNAYPELVDTLRAVLEACAAYRDALGVGQAMYAREREAHALLRRLGENT